MRNQEDNTLTTGVFWGMIYEDVIRGRLWKPRGAGVYLNIYQGGLEMPLIGPIHFWCLSISR